MLTKKLLQELNHRLSTYSHDILVETGVFTKEEWAEAKKLFEDIDKAYAEIVVSDYVKNPTEGQILDAQYALQDYINDKEFTELFVYDDADLPSEVEIPVSAIPSDVDTDQGIADWLSNTYGYYAEDFQYYYTNGDCTDYYVTNISWDREPCNVDAVDHSSDDNPLEFIKGCTYGFWNPHTYEVFDADTVEDDDAGGVINKNREHLLGFNYKRLTADEWQLYLFKCIHNYIKNPAEYIREKYPASGTGLKDRLQYVSIEEAVKYVEENKEDLVSR